MSGSWTERQRKIPRKVFSPQRHAKGAKRTAAEALGFRGSVTSSRTCGEITEVGIGFSDFKGSRIFSAQINFHLAQQDFVARIGSGDAMNKFPVLALLPTFALVLLIAVSAGAEIVLDHDILGRDASGMPALASMPVARAVIDIWNLALLYLAPPALAVLFLMLGARRHLDVNAVMLGGAMVCIVGGFLNLDAVWTGVRGTSHLDVGPVASIGAGLARAAINLVIFGLAVFLFIPRRE